MQTALKLASFVSLLVVGCSCTTAPAAPDAGLDGAVSDGGLADGSTADAGTDAGIVDDGGLPDGGSNNQDGGGADGGELDAGPRPCVAPERAVRLDSGVVCFASRDVTQLILSKFPGALNLPEVLLYPSTGRLPLFISSALDGGSLLDRYILAARYQDGGLTFLPPLVPTERIFGVDSVGNFCGIATEAIEPALWLRDGGEVRLSGVDGYCRFMSNGYWVASSSRGHRIARVGDARSELVGERPGDFINGVDDNGVVMTSRLGPTGFGELWTRLRDGGTFELNTGSGSFTVPSAISTSGVVAGNMDTGGSSEIAAWRLDGRSRDPFIRLRSSLPPRVRGVGDKGDLCGRFSGPQRSFVLPAGYPEVIETEEAFPELRGLECSGVLADGVFLFSLYVGEPRRSFSVATIRIGPD